MVSAEGSNRRAIVPTWVDALGLTEDTGLNPRRVNGAFGLWVLSGQRPLAEYPIYLTEDSTSVTWAKIPGASLQLVLLPMPTSLEDLLCSFQASMELDHMGRRLLVVLMSETFLVYVLL